MLSYCRPNFISTTFASTQNDNSQPFSIGAKGESQHVLRSLPGSDDGHILVAVPNALLINLTLSLT